MIAPAAPISVRAQVAATAGGEMAVRLAHVLSMFLAARALGVEGLGTVGLAWSLTFIAMAAIQGGPDLAGTRQLGQPGQGDGVIRHVITDVGALKLVLALAAFPLLLAAQWAAGHGGGGAVAQLAAQLAAATLAAMTHAWAFRALCRPLDQGLTRLSQAVATLLALWLLLGAWPHPLAVPLAEMAGALAGLLYGGLRLGGLARPSWPSWRRWRPLAGSALLLGAGGLAGNFAWMSPLLATARFASEETLSHMTGAVRLFMAAVGLFQILFQALFALQVRLLARDRPRGRVATLSLSVQAGGLALAAWLAVALAAPGLLPLAMGAAFTDSAPLLTGLCLALVPMAVASPVSYALMACGHSFLVARQAAWGALLLAGASAAGFLLLPPPVAVLAVPLAVSVQAVIILRAGVRHGVLGREGAGWASLANPRRLEALLHGH